MNSIFQKLIKFLVAACQAFIISSCQEPPNAQQIPTDNTDFPLVWQDQFTDLDRRRWALGDWTFNYNLCEFSPAMVQVTAQGLELRIAQKGADKGKYREKPYWGGEVYGLERYLYGRFEVEMKPFCPPGVVASFFLMYDERDGQGNNIDWYEIDIEFPGSTRKISYALHYGEGGGIKSVVKEVPLDFDASDRFHHYAIVWKPDSIYFTIDNRLSAEFTEPYVLNQLNQAMNIRMNYWVSESKEWVGRFYPSVLPITSLYRSVAYRRYQKTRPMSR
ncbi:MAG: family 16 glycosylhydrolase [candidate division KSB1 bacterium]|nr:family 16 glycosylhydrolase [candidate division KSB1 bacterium]MDZ7346365.1 family 16 glycosylhydrolase [candidate division KSB1 bacterium]